MLWMLSVYELLRKEELYGPNRAPKDPLKVQISFKFGVAVLAFAGSMIDSPVR